MPGRLIPLPCPALLWSLVLTLLFVSEASAHRLIVEAFLHSDNKVQVESWFSDGTIPSGAKVKVFRADDHLLHESQLDKNGIFVFPLEKAEPLRVLVSVMDGHSKELTITEAELTQKNEGSGRDKPHRSSNMTDAQPTVQKNEGPVPLGQRDTGLPVKEWLLGVAIVLAAGAFVLSVLNTRRLHELQRSSNHKHGAGQG